jgi:hypothetical protein
MPLSRVLRTARIAPVTADPAASTAPASGASLAAMAWMRWSHAPTRRPRYHQPHVTFFSSSAVRYNDAVSKESLQ